MPSFCSFIAVTFVFRSTASQIDSIRLARMFTRSRSAPGSSPPSFDKQYVRDFVSASGWNKEPPAPTLPDEVIAGTRERYVTAYERITGEPWDVAVTSA